MPLALGIDLGGEKKTRAALCDGISVTPVTTADFSDGRSITAFLRTHPGIGAAAIDAPLTAPKGIDPETLFSSPRFTPALIDRQADIGLRRMTGKSMPWYMLTYIYYKALFSKNQLRRFLGNDFPVIESYPGALTPKGLNKNGAEYLAKVAVELSARLPGLTGLRFGNSDEADAAVCSAIGYFFLAKPYLLKSIAECDGVVYYIRPEGV
ncbi:MAG: hypothetical protein A2Y33_00205 [Spirochaetes bacterium GWF1_51_8]|nr:MAG: hypothetical protein A2Y33_00205 [Spirochaetes bacterium GWF1_51_8]